MDWKQTITRAFITVLVLGSCASLAQAGLLANGPGTSADTLAWVAGTAPNYTDPINGDQFVVGEDGVAFNDFQVYFVAQGMGTIGQYDPTPSAPSLGAGPNSLYMAGPGFSPGFNDVGWSLTSITPYQFPDGSNYYSSSYAPGQYLPMYVATYSGPEVDLAAGTFAWATAMTFSGGVTAGLLTDTQASCLAQGNPNVCDGDIYSFNSMFAGPNYGYGPDFANNGAYDVVFNMSPEPGTWLLIAAGAGVLALSRRRRGA